MTGFVRVVENLGPGSPIGGDDDDDDDDDDDGNDANSNSNDCSITMLCSRSCLKVGC